MVTAINELKLYNNWLGWKTVRKQAANGDLKDTKVPIDPHTGNYASTDNPATWADFETTKLAIKKYNLDGFGFVFTKELGIIGIDLDNCVNPNGSLEEWAANIVTMLDSYTELSPSGSGLHVLVKGQIPHSMKRDKRGIEMYDQLRYFTITGKHWKGSPVEINKNQSGLSGVFNLYKTVIHIAEPIKVHGNLANPSPELIAEMLSHIPRQTDYSQCWLKILMAVYSVYPDGTGINLIESWSPGYEGEVAQKFRSFRKGTRVSFGTLVYFAKMYGWQPLGETDQDKEIREMFPHLSDTDREQIKTYAWKHYHDIMREQERRAWFNYAGFPDYILNLYTLGFSKRKIDTETGEIIIGDSLTVPFRENNKTVVNVEYRDLGAGITYEHDYPSLFHTSFDRQDCQMVILPDSVTAINTYLKIGECDYNFVGLPHMRILKETVDFDGAVVLLEPDTVDEYGLLALKGHCWFNRLPFNITDMLKSKLKIKELEWYIKAAKKI